METIEQTEITNVNTNESPAEPNTASSAEVADGADWEVLKNFSDFEINKISSDIRHKETKKIVRPIRRQDGYKLVKLRKTKGIFYVHRLMASQFLTNPDPNVRRFIDHIDRDRSNNSLSNLRFVTSSENNRNKNSRGANINYLHLKTLPENATRLVLEGRELRFQYYRINNSIFVHNSADYHRLYVDWRGRVRLAIIEGTLHKYKTFSISELLAMSGPAQTQQNVENPVQ
jgi:hypothetical protein